MFTQQLPALVFEKQREFIRAMEASRDFVWWAETLITEETKELKEAYNRPTLDDANLSDIFKELADVIYVVAGFYNTMPVYAPELISQDKNQELQWILDEAADAVSTVSQKLQIPLPLIIGAFELVHDSNMSKLKEDGTPIRREDGKILKGPNYKAPNMMPIVHSWKNFQLAQQGTQNAQDSE